MVKETWTVLKLIDWTARFFKDKGIHNPRLDAELLLAHTLKLDRVGIYLNYDKPLTKQELSLFKGFVKRRAGREPLHYITGAQEFWSLGFRVRPGVLIPRPETEILVEETIREVKSQKSKIKTDKDKTVILDLCTGCGCIAIALAKELADSKIYAVDNSGAALNIASQNALEHGVKDRITFLSGNLFQSLSPSSSGGDGEGYFDIVVSNPPYIRSREIETLEPEIKDYEPISALDGGKDGLNVIRSIAREAPEYLKKKGSLIMEIAFDQAKDVEYIIEKRGAYGSVSILKDLSGKDRVVKAVVNE